MAAMQALRSHQPEPIPLMIGSVLTKWSGSRQRWPLYVPKNAANNGTVPELATLRLQSRSLNAEPHCLDPRIAQRDCRRAHRCSGERKWCRTGRSARERWQNQRDGERKGQKMRSIEEKPGKKVLFDIPYVVLLPKNGSWALSVCLLAWGKSFSCGRISTVKPMSVTWRSSHQSFFSFWIPFHAGLG